MLEERIRFCIEGFKLGGVTLTRRVILEGFSQMPESQGILMPMILDELDLTQEPEVIEQEDDEEEQEDDEE
jgi:hypothetical protein